MYDLKESEEEYAGSRRSSYERAFRTPSVSERERLWENLNRGAEREYNGRSGYGGYDDGESIEYRRVQIGAGYERAGDVSIRGKHESDAQEVAHTDKKKDGLVGRLSFRAKSLIVVYGLIILTILSLILVNVIPASGAAASKSAAYGGQEISTSAYGKVATADGSEVLLTPLASAESEIAATDAFDGFCDFVENIG